MGDLDILSQEEVDALLGGVEGGDIAAGQGVPAPGQARTIDLANHERIVRGRMPTLEMVNDRFARGLRTSLFNLLRRPAVISVEGVRTEKFSEYLHSLLVPVSLNLVRMQPLRGTALFVLDPRLVFALVEHYFGGDGRFYTKLEGREFSPTELRVVRMALDLAFADLKLAWEPVLDLDFEYQSSEENPQFANIVSPTEVVVVSSFRIDFDGSGGALHVTLPYSMIEPIRGLLNAGMQSDRSDVDQRWFHSLDGAARRASVDVSCTLIEKPMTLRDVVSMRAGDVIPIDMPEELELCAEGVPLLRGTFGTSRNLNALKVVGPVETDRA